MSHDPLMDPPQRVEYGSLKSYIWGFIFSVIITLVSYYIVTQHLVTGWVSDLSVALLALLQAGTILFLFLNLAREPKPRWNLLIFLFMIMVIVIIVGGSIWIIENLNYNLMVT